MRDRTGIIHSPHVRKRICRVVLLMFVLPWLIAVGHAERLPVRSYTSADGLGSSSVNCLMRDSQGFVWFCTRDGLSRFDGSRFVTYQVGREGAPPGIEDILETRAGIYWIVTTGGLYRFDPHAPAAAAAKNETRPTLNAKLVGNVRGKLYEDRHGTLWLASADLYRVAENDGVVSLQKVEVNLPANRSIGFNLGDISEGQDGSLWMLTSWGLVRRLPDGREMFYQSGNTRNDPLYSLLEDNAGRIWLARPSGVYVIRPETPAQLSNLKRQTVRQLDELAQLQTGARLPEQSGEIFKYRNVKGFAKSHAKFLCKTADGHVWISGGDGLVEFDGQTFSSYTTAQGLPEGSGRMLEDPSGNLWLQWGTGVARLERRGLTSYGIADGLKNPAILVIGETLDGQLYVATVDFSLNRFTNPGFQIARPQLPADAAYIWTFNLVFQDSRGEWWFLTNERLYRFAATRGWDSLARAVQRAVYTSRDGLKSDHLFHVFEDRQSNLWFSTRGIKSAESGLTKWDRATEKFYVFSEAEGFPANKSPSSFAEDRAGNLWIGFYQGGMARYAQGRFTEFTTDGEVPAGHITALLMDRSGRLWVASSDGGLSRIDDPGESHPHFTHYTTANGLASDNVRSLTEDLYGNIYVGTARGIDRLSPDAARIRHYSVSNGLAADFVNAAFRDRNGVLWFGTMSGLSRLVPEKETNSPAPPIWLSGLRIAGQSYPFPELGSAAISGLELGSTQNNLQIDFFGIDFNPNESLRYQFMLAGADRDWSAPTDQGTVNYANLSPGDYRFIVRAINTDGMASLQPASISFRILPPFWQRWWFITACVLSIGGAVFALERYRTRSRRAVTESEKRFRTLAETAADAIITIDENSIIVYVNLAAENVFGYTTPEMVGANLTMLMPEYLRHLHHAGLSRYLETGHKHIAWEAVELPGLHKMGREIPLELSFGEFTRDGRRYFTGIARDITERKRVEGALRKAREERFTELQRVRSGIATNLHDDIGTSLTQIAILGEVAQQQIGVSNTIATENLTRITSVSNDLIEAMSDIVWAINPEKDQLSNLTQRMRRFAHDVFTARQVEFRFRAPGPEQDVQLGANIRREVFLVFKESVNNMVKHSGCGQAEIEFQIKDEWLSLRVSDNGIGFDPSLLSRRKESDILPEKGGNGLLSMQRRAVALGGEYSVVSQQGEGTTVTLRVPLGGSQPGNGENLPAHTGGDG